VSLTHETNFGPSRRDTTLRGGSDKDKGIRQKDDVCWGLFAFGGPTRVKPQTLGTGQIIRGCWVLIPTNLTGTQA